MHVNPYLTFNGQCEAAFKFYEQCFDGKIQMMMTHDESPMADQVPIEWRKKIIHATLTVGETVLQGADVPSDHYEEPKGFSVTLQLNDLAAAERIFQALSEDGAVQLPMQQTFWAVGFGMVVDRFGIPWMVNCGHS